MSGARRLNPVVRRKLRSFVGIVLVVASTVSAQSVREPAVAGLFYPADRTELAATVDRLIDAAADAHLGEVRAIVVPHAGYAFSGPVAANAFRQLRGRSFQTVVVMGPAHFAELSAASVASATAYRSPLGDVPIAAVAQRLGRAAPFRTDAPARVQRPEWAKTLPGSQHETADTWEHSVEVEIPFLQRSLGKFSVVPVVVGDVDPAKAAVALSGVLDADTLLVVSSDLSHYHPYAEAQALDRKFIEAVMHLDVSGASQGEACGRIPILVLMQVAKQRGWQPHLLDLRNSGDTAGDKSSVVGYAAIAFVDPARPKPHVKDAPTPASNLPASDRAFLLHLARQAIEQTVKGERVVLPPRSSLSPALLEPRACFVTLMKDGELRGCIGSLVPEQPLFEMVASAARSAALRDPRFPSVSPAELDRLHLEISVLTEPRPLAFSSPADLLRKLRAGIDGVVLNIGTKEATYLPQVWQDIPDKVTFLNSLAEKAGAAANAWRGKDVTVQIYQAESFEEPKTK
jgi:AmmeMemoRadiSam system protein B/AmmeMemoRadiSam system protein A